VEPCDWRRALRVIRPTHQRAGDDITTSSNAASAALLCTSRLPLPLTNLQSPFASCEGALSANVITCLLQPLVNSLLSRITIALVGVDLVASHFKLPINDNSRNHSASSAFQPQTRRHRSLNQAPVGDPASSATSALTSNNPGTSFYRETTGFNPDTASQAGHKELQIVSDESDGGLNGLDSADEAAYAGLAYIETTLKIRAQMRRMRKPAVFTQLLEKVIRCWQYIFSPDVICLQPSPDIIGDTRSRRNQSFPLAPNYLSVTSGPGLVWPFEPSTLLYSLSTSTPTQLPSSLLLVGDLPDPVMNAVWHALESVQVSSIVLVYA
ncbi:unnamed protein product, partial [Protopolystoma xenopodis]